MSDPQTLLEAVRYFSDLNVATKEFAMVRWPEGIRCPRCESIAKHSYINTRRIYMCKSCRKQFSPKAGTIFEDSPLGMDKWMVAVWVLTNTKNGTSSHELGRSLGVTQKTAWFMLQRIRRAMTTGTFEKMSGEVEVDETFIGQKSRNMHKHIRAQKITGTGGKDKAMVVGVLERGGHVKAKVVASRKKKDLQGIVKDQVKPGAELYTDSLRSYEGLDADYVHQFVDHSVKYAEGKVHTNGLENFWSLLKRSIYGTYVSVMPFHLFRYVDEQAFRFNYRKEHDADRFRRVLSSCRDRRLTYKEVTGKPLVA